ncbi:MAG: aldo/keto reductase [Candidatus Eremiobacteraeota bacterium]|nr:aldo/keto reductase [Candidatus Eremiobacteraeota bacterium]
MKNKKSFSKIGFGTYRITSSVKEHEESLEKAIRGGINIIDTSSNYTDGRSEKLIGEVIDKLSGEINREDITIVSKFGYIQGQNISRYWEGFKPPDIVHYDRECFHCIHPVFMRDQLKRSLDRLRTDCIDIYLIHNPEYYLLKNARSENDVNDARKEMLRRIAESFIALEEEVKKGTINSYGISSNTFAVPEDDIHFLPYLDLPNIAWEAAKKVGNVKSSFTTIQLPGNMLETVGLEECAVWARGLELNVLINRPLNAYYENRLFRLATYNIPEEYDEIYGKTLEWSGRLGMGHLARHIENIDKLKNSFLSMGHFEYLFKDEIAPPIKTTINFLQDEDRDLFLDFLSLYKLSVKANLSVITKSYLEDMGFIIDETIERIALKFLLDKKQVTTVLVGMKKLEYVDTALEIMKSY